MQIYKNADGKCECWQCELKNTCQYVDKYQRLPRTTPGALGLCKKLQDKKKECQLGHPNTKNNVFKF